MAPRFRVPVVCAVLLAAGWTQSVSAQDADPPGDQPGAVEPDAPETAPAGGAVQNSGPAPNVTVPTVTSGGAGAKWPPLPVTFYRGNQPPNVTATALPMQGFYFSTFRVGFYLLLVTFWVWVSAWVNEDSEQLKVRNAFWNALMMSGGAAGLLLAVGMPAFYMAFFLIAFTTGTPLGL